MKRAILIALFASLIVFGAHDAWAQNAPQGDPTLNINLGSGDGLTARVLQLAALITVLSLAPSILIMTTSFVRIVVVLSLLAHRHRSAAGAAERGDRVAVALPHRLRHGAGLEPGLRRRHRSGHAQ